MKRFGQLILKFRIPILAAILCIFTISLYGARDVSVDNSIKIWFVEDDPNMQDFAEFNKTYGGDEFISVALKTKNVDSIFNARDLKIISDISADLKKVKGVTYVVSVTDAVDVWGVEDGVHIGDLMEEFPKNEAEIEKLRERVFSNPLYIGTLISEDGKTTLITARLKDISIIDERRPEIVREVRGIAKKYEKEWGDTIHIAGIPVLNVSLNELTFKDLTTFIPITILLTVFTLFITMRRWSAVALSISSVGISVVIAMGIYKITGKSMSMMTTMVPTLIMVIGVADSIHIINHYFERALDSAGKSKREIIVNTIGVIGVPCLMTTVTTAVGFSTLGLSQMVPVRETGLFTAAGILTAFIITMTFIPISYSFMRLPKKKTPHDEGRGVIVSVLNWCYRISTSHPVPVVILGAALFFGSVYYMTKINVETQDIEFMRESHPLRVAYHFMEDNVGNVTPVEFIIEGEPGTGHEPNTLKAVEDFQRYLAADPDISTSLAVTDLIKRLNMAFDENNPESYRIPETRGGIAQLLLLYEMAPDGELEYFLNFDSSGMRISGRAKNITSKQCKILLNKTDKYFKENLPEGLTGRMTGIVPLYVHMVDYIIRSQMVSFSLAFVIIFLLLGLQLRSVRLGLISIIPNTIPIAMTMGAMGLFGINLDTATVMISTVAIGIAVDDTIHFLNRYKLEFREVNDHEEAIKRALNTSGRAIVTTSIILLFGFWTLLFGSFKPTTYFGFLSGVTMLTALIGDLLVLPAALVLFRPKF
ncbi:MAG: RND family transporter [Deltaproteobacteria bacterium]|uniref:RND family transporter n=1 Tax=Candidatus Zymogenus saltonus TaxID=2844893 RepID=A0A9D8KBH4_9DELT|nr:RND family transporter [Candidatus Zymogenus saltonus]